MKINTTFLHHIIPKIKAYPQAHLWTVEVFIVVLATFTLTMIEGVIYRRLLSAVKYTKTIWDDALLHALHQPLRLLLWLLGLTFAADITHPATSVLNILDATSTVRRIGGVVIIAWFLSRFIGQIEMRLTDPGYTARPHDKTTANIVSKLLRLSVIVTAILVIFQEFGIHISGLLAFTGGGAIILGFGAKDVLANIFGGLIIYLDRPFSVGDWIKITEKNIEGFVEHIGWRLTRIRTFDKRPLYVPNAVVSTVPIMNPSRMTNRRIKTVFGLRYQDAGKIAAIVADIEAYLKSHPGIDPMNKIAAKFTGFGPHSLEVLLLAYTKSTQWLQLQEIKQEILLKVIDIVYNKHQAQLALPARTVYAGEYVPLETGFLAKAQTTEGSAHD